MGTELKNNDTLVRDGICKLEKVMSTIPGTILGDSEHCPLKHSFVDGAYVREIFMPKGALIVSKIHRITHPYFILKGDVTILTENGEVRIKAPFHGITPTGTKRALYIHEDTVWVTVHVTKETDLEKIEEEVIAKNFNELGIEVDEIISPEESNKFIDFLKKVNAIPSTPMIEENKNELS